MIAQKQTELEGGESLKDKDSCLDIERGNKMKLLGRGRGILGLKKSKNIPFVITTILAIALITYGIIIKSLAFSLGFFALYLIVVVGIANN